VNQRNLGSFGNDEIENNKIIKSFKKDFLSIKSKGFVPSNRIHNTGIGKTFEDLIGIHENNNLLVDYEGLLEIKSTRELSGSMVTLFTKSPTYPNGANTYLREKYGQPDPKSNNMKILHTTISASKFNTYKGKYGFRLFVSKKDEKIFIIIKDLENNQIIDTSVYYTFEDLKQIVGTKCKYIAFINAETKVNNGKESFYFKNATLLSCLTFDKFIDYVNRGIIVYDIRIGVYKSGHSYGKTHDHGSGFRIQKRDINKAFKIEQL